MDRAITGLAHIKKHMNNTGWTLVPHCDIPINHFLHYKYRQQTIWGGGMTQMQQIRIVVFKHPQDLQQETAASESETQLKKPPQVATSIQEPRRRMTNYFIMPIAKQSRLFHLP